VKLEDKKILAEWLGEVVSDHIPLGLYMVHRMLLLDKWNPDTDHNDFKEVWNKLKALDLDVDLLGKLDCCGNCVKFADLIFNHLPKVMEAVMEVINES